MTDPVLRQATAADVPVLLELLAILDTAGDHPLTATEAAITLAGMARYPFFRTYLAEHEGRAVGTYTIIIMENLGHRGRPSALVENVAVRTDTQGLGIGRRMMEHARALCRERGCYKMALSSNLVREEAHAFYEHLGFEKHGFSFRIAP